MGLQGYAQQTASVSDTVYTDIEDSTALPEVDSTYDVSYDESGHTEEEDYNADYDFYFSITDSAAPIPADVRRLTASEWTRLKSDPDLKYEKENEDIPKAAPKKQSRFWFDFIEGVFNFFTGIFGKILLWTIIIGVVLLIVYQIVKNNGLRIFSRKDKKILSGGTDELADDFIPESWEAIIHKAETEGNFRLAIRHSYRHILILMNDKGIIEYNPSKSNYQYVSLLRDKAVYSDFVRLLHHYEFAWYGGFDISATAYASIKAIYHDLKHKI
ncbi:hypothetical protein DBR32_15110 [Taibaiella sp. KBW10]|nr:hypothetical protein DBR32_15110 [Taibaiella sp. KBW10]